MSFTQAPNVTQAPAVNQAPVTPGVLHIHRMETLQALIDLAAFNPSVGHSVRDLTIALPVNTGDTAYAIRRALRMTPNVEKLILTVSFPLPAYLLGGVTFPGLNKFSTNLPHSALPSFLHRYPSITHLSLRGVDCTTCPIRGVHFPHLIALQCSSRCFRTGIGHGHFVHADDRLALVPVSNEATRTIPTLRIEILALDFFPDKRDIVANVAGTAPNLRTLKLNEKPFPQHDNRVG
ncbi:hypothetical protein GSI_02017 [Ganoderma sinense ZZ0214-1]|uniref:Uncharacterized protein n=1 Tax=Ganoderma sinense ZZ0214-1 TaxID=1077348 RepID=A0A2G8SNF3_9APHY|nr:hypothetical protein GSI_02017 [Ganoderma sinense ZZ0214-1]